MVVRAFTTSLEFFWDSKTNKSAFQMLKEGCGARLKELGLQLEQLYADLDLGNALSSDALAGSTRLHPLADAAGGRRVTQADAMPEFAAQFPYDAPDAPQQMYEHKFLHGVLMLGAALHEGFQAEVAAAAGSYGVLPQDHSLQPAPPKGFARVIGKLASEYR